MKNKICSWPVARLLLAAAVSLSLFIAATPTSPEESHGCKAHDHEGLLIFYNDDDHWTNVSVAGPKSFTFKLDPGATAHMGTPTGLYKWVAIGRDSIGFTRIQSGTLNILKYSSRRYFVNIRFPED